MPRYQEDNGYVSMLDPNIFQFQQQLLNKKQQQYDTGYSIALDTKDKYSAFDTDPEDVQVRNQALGQFTGNVNELVQSKYNGDWGRASKEVAGLVTKFKQDPVWETMQYAKQQRAMEDELTARFGPSALPFASMRGKSVLGAEGKLLKPEEMRVNVEERLNDLPVMDKIWSELSPRSLSGTSISEKVVNGKKIPVIVDAQGKEISESMINRELNNMLNIYRDTDNYKQRIREYSQINGMSVDEAEEKIKQDFLEVGMSKKMRQYDERWQPFNLKNYGFGDETNPNQPNVIPTYETTYEDKDREEGKKLLEKGVSGIGLKGALNLNPNIASNRYAMDIMSRPAIQNLSSPQNIGEFVNKNLELETGRWMDNEVLGNIALKADDVYQKYAQPKGEAASAQYGQFNISNIPKANNERSKYIRNELLKYDNTLSDKDIRKIDKALRKGYQEANREYNKAIKVAVENESSKIGDNDLLIYGPNVYTESGLKYKKQLEYMSELYSPSNFSIIEGKYSDESYIKNDKKKFIEAYGTKKPIIKGFGFDNTIGITVGITNPDEKVQAAKLDNARPEQLYAMILAGGKPEALQSEIASKLKTGNLVPDVEGNNKLTSFKIAENISEDNKKLRSLYIGDARDEDYVTNNVILQLNDYLSANNIDPLPVNDITSDNINEPYYFNDNIDLFMVASILDRNKNK